jgi:hypothetical protein
MKKNALLFLIPILFTCTQQTDQSTNCDCIKMKLRQHDITGIQHHLIVENYCDECLDIVLEGDLVKKYLDTVRTITPISFVSLYSTDENFPKSRKYQDFPTIDKDLIIEYAFLNNRDSIYSKCRGVFLYVNGKRRYITYPTWDK